MSARGLEPKNKTLLEAWKAAWPEALAVWSPYTRLSEPEWFFHEGAEEREGFTGSFAAIRLNDNRVFISLRKIRKIGLEDYAIDILAHEIGHHVLCPANLLEAGRALAVATMALPTVEKMGPRLVNMWQDLLINDRLVRIHDQRHFEIYEKINEQQGSASSDLWALYMRAFEILWGLSPGRLAGSKLKGAIEGDAHLVARMVRVYRSDWMAGVGGFCALCLPYLLKDAESTQKAYSELFDTDGMGEGCEVPMGIMDIDGLEILHPSRDPNIVDTPAQETEAGEGLDDQNLQAADGPGGGLGQNREPHLFGQVLEALGLKLDSHEAAVKFYREKAVPHLVPFPTMETEESTEPLMEGLEPWDVGHPADEVDWLQSVLVSPRVIPGVSTVRRSWGVMGGQEREREPLDLDLYVDCSGSIPNPQLRLSYLTLAGAIVVISALRTGAKVQATLWSGSGQYDSTPGFIRDETAVLKVLTGYLGGSTAFPNHILRKTYQNRRPNDRPVHILILSDEGIDTMSYADELNNPGMELSKMALEKARGGGTMVLNLWRADFLKREFSVASQSLGWNMHKVNDWSGLLEFAKKFARLKYGQQKAGGS